MTEHLIDLWTIPLQLPLGEQAAALLSDEEQAQAARFAFDEHRRRFINRRGALRSILAGYLGLRPRQVEFGTNRFGRPWLPQAGGELSFSASHSRELAIVAVSGEGSIGADLEWVHELPDRSLLARSYFTPREQRAIEHPPDGDRTEAFFRCWTRKEAFVKALGVGLQYPLDRFDVPAVPLPAQAKVDVRDDTVGAWAVRDLELPPGYVGALVHALEQVAPLGSTPTCRTSSVRPRTLSFT